jgi:hypothetical protein
MGHGLGNRILRSKKRWLGPSVLGATVVITTDIAFLDAGTWAVRQGDQTSFPYWMMLFLLYLMSYDTLVLGFGPPRHPGPEIGREEDDVWAASVVATNLIVAVQVGVFAPRGGSGMNALILDIVVKVIVALAIAAAGTAAGFLLHRRRYRERFRAAAKIYADRIGQQIDKAYSEKDGGVLVHGRAIISIRDDLRDHLLNLNGLLNTDIDRLKEEISVLERNPSSPEAIKRASDTISVLKEKWPIKAEQVEIEIRKLLTELGLEPK